MFKHEFLAVSYYLWCRHVVIMCFFMLLTWFFDDSFCLVCIIYVKEIHCSALFVEINVGKLLSKTLIRTELA